MSLVQIFIDTDKSIEELKNLVGEKQDLNHIINFLSGIAGGVEDADVKIQVAPVKGVGSVTFTGKPTDAQTFIIGNGTTASTTLVAKDSPVTGTTGLWFGVSSDGHQNAVNLAASLNANLAYSDPQILSASVSASSVILTNGIGGLVGEFVDITSNLSNVTVDAQPAAGVSDGTVTDISSK